MPGTTIISDCWSSYQNLSNHGYTHLTVNHSRNFINLLSGAHTNTIKGMWNHARMALPLYGTSKKYYSNYFIEFIYRRKFFSLITREKRFFVFINHIKLIFKS